MLTVYKASAGSGKTFQLVVEYLKLLLKNPQNYRHILAVTFTNKATNEMKTRILETLNDLASNQPSKYISEIQKENHLSEAQIRANSKVVLKNILHDYNRFSINTIDSFTQRTIKAFNRELGISPNYRLELDSEMILAEATDRLLAKIDKDKKLLSWLKDFSKEKIEDSYSQRIEEDIKSLGKELFKENFQLFFSDNSESVYNRENLISFGKELNLQKIQFENHLKNLGKKAVAIIAENGFTVDDFYYAKNGIAGFIYSIANGELKEPGSRVLSAEAETEKWYNQKHREAAKIHALAESFLQPLLHEILEYSRNNEQQYYTVLAVLKQLRMLGILTDLKEEIRSLLHEKGILQMSDSNLLLSKIIGQSDSPFIYEKTGSFYHHFMLDEFQDTSGLQWHNFRPLIINSLAEGNKNLLVGDVKQSIYRWRNSDYRILAEQIHFDFDESQIKEYHLDRNWRSDKNIIDFNNQIFENMKAVFEERLFSTINENDFYIQRFRNITSSITQIPGNPEAERKGFVKIRFFEEEQFKEESPKVLVEQVKQLQDKGIKASEIAILIRRNKEGTPIIEEFLAAAGLEENSKYNLSVLSNESLFLFASQGVLTVIDTINFIINPGNEITKVALINHWANWLKPELQKRGKPEAQNPEFSEQIFNTDFNSVFENELAPKIELIKKKVLLTSLDEAIIQICSVFQLFEIETELPFIQTLIDKAGELKSSLSNDLSNLLFWWNETGLFTSVNVNEEIDSIRLLTVHKSKGLEFKAVLIPWFDWRIGQSGKFAPILWCKPETEPFNQFPLLPVVAGNDMKKSLFKSDFYEESANHFFDIFNMAYVAFTRAKSALIIHCPQPKETKSNNEESLKPIQFLLNKALENLGSDQLFSECWNEDRTVFQLGSIEAGNEKPEPSKSVIIKNYQFNDFSERVKLRNSGEDFLITGERTVAVKNRGKIIHDILSSVKTKTDVETACIKALANGKINEIELGEIQEAIKISFENPLISDWFSGKYQILNERSLLTSEKILRPDRIMISENEAVVVDYKTGEKKSDNYNRQVTRYAKILKETGFEKVEGFLWYINQNEVEKVCELGV
ncbi:MAG: uvrd/rep [Prolixibacteraceae bacterium]|nr:MAG: uvrd/rep [Prolixibacteraceae bacterium]